MLAQADKDRNRVEERLQDLDTEDIEYLIGEATTRLKASKLRGAWERRCQRVSYVDLQSEMGNQRETRNLKLYQTYQKEWADGRQKALLQLTQGLTTGLTKKRQCTAKQKTEFADKRVSVADHDAKHREKNEMNDVVELIKDHGGPNFWEANLRNLTT